jgi:hypothetical protein
VPTRALLLDFDGTLADSLPALRRVYERFVAGLGGEASEDEFDALNGPPLREVVQRLCITHQQREHSDEDFELYEKLVAEELLRIAPAADTDVLLDAAIARGIRCAIVTSNQADLVTTWLEANGLGERCNVIVSGEEVNEGKPSSDRGFACRCEISDRRGHSHALAHPIRRSRWRHPVHKHIERRPASSRPRRSGKVIRALPLAQDARLRCTDTSPPLDRAAEEEVAAIWRAAASDPAQSLHDNPIVVVASYDERQLEAFVLPYRYFFAQRVRPELFEQPLKALAVSGIVLCEGRIVLGRRANWVTQDAGMLELAPSGSVDADIVRSNGEIDLERQFDREICEELGVEPGAATGHRISGLIDDEENHVVDIVIRATLQCGFSELLEAHSRLERPEYTELMAVTARELQGMIGDRRGPVSSVSSGIFTHFCVGHG